MDFSNIRFNWAFVVALLAALASLSAATSRELQQEIGTDICYCAPNAYEFELDFSLTCPPVNITVGDAVAQTTCMVSPFGNEQVADLVPVRVTSIDVLELNQNLQVMVQETIQPTEAFLDKDTFSYVSYAAIPGEVVKPEDLPRAIQLNVVGVNQFEEEIINVYLITFTNSCGAYPVLYEGQWAGWTRFYDIGPPSPELCPAAATPAPTMDPTPFFMSMSMSMSMDLGLDEFTIEDLLDGEYEYKPKSAKSKGKGKGGKKEKEEKSSKAKLTKPLGKDGKSKDGGKAGKSYKSKDGSKGGSKDGGKAGKSKDGSKAGKSEKSKDGKSSKDSTKTANKLTKPGQKVHKGKDSKSQKSKDGSKDGKTEKAKDGSKDGKSEKSKDGSKAGKSYKYEENGRKEAKSTKESDKLAKSKGKGGTRRQRLRI